MNPATVSPSTAPHARDPKRQRVGSAAFDDSDSDTEDEQPLTPGADVSDSSDDSEPENNDPGPTESPPTPAGIIPGDESGDDTDDESFIDDLFEGPATGAIISPPYGNRVIEALEQKGEAHSCVIKKRTPGTRPGHCSVNRDDILAFADTPEGRIVIARETKSVPGSAPPAAAARPPVSSNDISVLAIAREGGAFSDFHRRVVESSGISRRSIFAYGSPTSNLRMPGDVSATVFFRQHFNPLNTQPPVRPKGFVVVISPGMASSIICPTYGNETKEAAAKRVAEAIGEPFTFPMDEVQVSSSAITSEINLRTELCGIKDRMMRLINTALISLSKCAVKDLPVSKDVAYLLTMWGIPLTDPVAARIAEAFGNADVDDIVRLALGVGEHNRPLLLDFICGAPGQSQVFLEAVKNVSEYVCIVTSTGSRFTGAQAIIPAIAQVFYDQADDAYEHFTREHIQATGAMSKIDTDSMDDDSPLRIAIDICRNHQDAITAAIAGLEDPSTSGYIDAAAAKVCEDRGHPAPVHAMLVRIGTAFQIFDTCRTKATAAARRRAAEERALAEVTAAAAEIEHAMTTRSKKRKVRN